MTIKRYYLVNLFMIAVSMALLACAWCYYESANRIEVITVEVPVVRERVITQVETIVEYQELRDFSSLEELNQWLEDTPIIIPAYPSADCDDWAIKLRNRAFKDGYIMSLDVIGRNETTHIVNSVIAGRSIYYIEPQNHSVRLRCPLD